MAKNCFLCGRKLPIFDTIEREIASHNVCICDDCDCLIYHVSVLNNMKEVDNQIQKFDQLAASNMVSGDIVDEVHKIYEDARAKVAKKEEKKYLEEQFVEHKNNLMLTTTNSFEGYRVVKYIGIISENRVYKNSWEDNLDASFEVTFPGFKAKELTSITELISKGSDYCMEKFKENAVKAGANAVIGIDIESTSGAKIVQVAINGTAVVIEKIED